MGRADGLAIDGGIAGIDLMTTAGRAVADTACRMARHDTPVLVLAGPGNNGGDGFVAARFLRRRGYRVEVLLSGARDKISGDARLALEAMEAGGVRAAVLEEDALATALAEAGLVIDALFGAGLARPLGGAVASAVARINESRVPVLAVDLPSGLNGANGQAMGCAVEATRTITFFRPKPGHVLLPGRELCGSVEVVDIGIAGEVLTQIGVTAWRNGPDLWLPACPAPGLSGHKYTRGHALVVSGPALSTGAARLAAGAALRAGAGLVSVATPPSAALVNAMHLTAVMLTSFKGAAGLAQILEDPRFSAVAIGPGAGIGDATRALVGACLSSGADVVLDADALTSFSSDREALFAQISARGGAEGKRPPATVLTPHDGEFARLFPDLRSGEVPSKLERARRAASRSGAVVVLKGADTVIAAPDGRAAINDNAPPWLATAGSGDVLTGIAAGLLARGMPAFEAAAMAVWVHGAAGQSCGAAMTAEDLEPALRGVLADPALRPAENGSGRAV
ncbi:bifunctional ADP-dependent NAD(P)H-hydrate dehydratase/NAD(P)H-hydrate epimerase [Stappia stellulata]|uniref:bifunctional ADP-dependent NAD(P)H-hydrate dehydratase/NAD(P)H-hydrate epimerase n=1 Tax=Stappia stellulata TaxID=71235 RepID=UPI00068829A9|nr:bifunctional ADP-dependent NAD(P)H-hydrate dehydratase/NAD(P)H-hydrate epimerase [Stappia stellulata]